MRVPAFKKELGFETTEARSKMMRKMRSTNTVAECILRKALWNRGIRYRLNVKNLPGKPDIVIKKFMVAIFVDGEFWHGYNWDNVKEGLKSNRDFWIPKIERNIQRDKENNLALEALGFKVMRFWSKAIKGNTQGCVDKILPLLGSCQIYKSIP